MSDQDNKPISTYDELQTKIAAKKKEFDSKQQASYWQRYVIRRIPLFTIPMLVFYSTIFALGFVKDIGSKAVTSLVPSLPFSVYISQDVLCSLFAVVLVHLVFVGLKYEGMSKTSRLLHKLAFNLLMMATIYSISALIYYEIHAIALGVVVFAPLCILPLLVDRTLGWTRQNDRFKLFSSKMQGLIELNLARESLGVEFSERNILEYIGILEQFESQKYNDTVSDSFYILSQVEKLKPQA
ncbi:antiviral RADAR system accessory protein RdrD [Pseudoalteromonas rubra]|uniref:Uncharacterized protein n=1 Tax=Pseudoalteromonas rubra TaxID=43658 RepID=A0A0U3GPE2_9GAMM|nr:antiviral RADAR system accessory protein RdrD [Pseudoalteromonas rubra]ALU44891.1 hypothetical protein AT705_19200 [Pseudoalteromonas rubra]